MTKKGWFATAKAEKTANWVLQSNFRRHMGEESTRKTIILKSPETAKVISRICEVSFWNYYAAI